jgi:hypothetical protein
MKDWSVLKGSGQNEALVNELKGNLFEYLVGSLLARGLNLEAKFVNDFNQQNGGQSKSDLVGYQQWLIEADRNLYLKLPKLAQSAFQYIKTQTDLLDQRRWLKIIVVGKMASGMGDESLAESDLLFVDDQEKLLGLSLKLVKKHAYVNTKSAGIRSFIKKYFSEFLNSNSKQVSICECLDRSFTQMLTQLYEYADLDVDAPVATQRSIDPQWIERGLPELPGELAPEAKKIVHAHYHRVASELKDVVLGFFNGDRDLFLKCLAPLVGFGFEDIRQLTCYHDDGYDKATFNYEDFSDLRRDLSKLEFVSVQENSNILKSGFEMKFGRHILQIRVKPMNKFTVSGLKVNCSVKVIKNDC